MRKSSYLNRKDSS